MLWFLKSLGVYVVLPGAALLGGLSALMLGGALAIPVIAAGMAFGDLPYTTVMPLIVAVIVGALEARASPPVTASSSRAHPTLLTVFALVSVTFYSCGYCISLSAVGGGDFSAARNMAGYVALLFLGQAAFGLKQAPLVPVISVVVGTIFGRIGGQVQPWAWPVLQASISDFLLAVVVLIPTAFLVVASAGRYRERFYGLVANS